MKYAHFHTKITDPQIKEIILVMQMLSFTYLVIFHVS